MMLTRNLYLSLRGQKLVVGSQKVPHSQTKLGPTCGTLQGWRLWRQLQANSNLDVGLEGPSAAVGEFEDHAADGAALAVLHVPLDVQLQLLGLGQLKNEWYLVQVLAFEKNGNSFSYQSDITHFAERVLYKQWIYETSIKPNLGSHNIPGS